MITLKNRYISVALDDHGGIHSIDWDGLSIAMDSDCVMLETDFGTFRTLQKSPELKREDENCAVFSWDTGSYRLSLEYHLFPEKRWLQRVIRVENPEPLSIYRVTCRHEMSATPSRVLDHHVFWNAAMAGLIRYDSIGMFTGFEHPFFRVIGDGNRVETVFDLSLILKSGEGYVSEPNFFGPYRLSGHLLKQVTPVTSMRYNDVAHTRYRNPDGHIPLDLAEVSALQEYARDYLRLRVDRFKLIFYQFFIPLPQQPETDEDENVYYHYIDNFVKMGGDLVTFNPLVRNVTPGPSDQSYWILAPEGSRAERILQYARDKGLEIGFYMGSAAGNAAYCTSPMVPFAMDNKTEWKKRDRSGAFSGENCIASDAFAEWFYQVQHNTIEKYGITLWDWDPGPGNAFFCYSADHGHIPGKGAYKGFRNAMRVVDRLREDFPQLYIQGFHGTKEYGLWGFRGFDQHECYWEQDPYNMSCIYPDFSEDRLTAGGMRFQSAWNQLFRFMPPELNHALASRMTQYCGMPQLLRKFYDVRGWKYAFFSSLAVGASMTVTMIPEDVDSLDGGNYLAFYRKWIPWAREHFEYARYSKPFGAQVACGAVDGFARIKNEDGFLFLFNPGPVDAEGIFHLDEEIGLTKAGHYMIDYLYPNEGARLFDVAREADVFAHGDAVHLVVPAFGCIVLELKPLYEEPARPRWCGLPGNVRLEGETAVVEGCEGPEGEYGVGWLVCDEPVNQVTVNGQDLPFMRHEGCLEIGMLFGKKPMMRHVKAWTLEDQTPLTPMKHIPLRDRQMTAQFDMPSEIRVRLDALKPEDEVLRNQMIEELKETLHRQNYAWAQPHRLHVTFPFLYPDHVEGLSAELNGRPLSLELADAWHDGIQAKIVWFADITDDVVWDGVNTLEIHVGYADADSFLGARLEYPEGKATGVIRPALIPQACLSKDALGLPRPLLEQPEGARHPVIENAWIVDGLVSENHEFELCASVNLPADELEGVYASAQISIDGASGKTLRADQRLDYDPATHLWRRIMKPGSRRLLIIDGKDISVWAVTRRGVVSDAYSVPVEWQLGAL